MHACLCVLSRDSFTSAAVLLCSSWRQRCSRWMGIACCPHTHSAQSPAQTSAPTSPLLRMQACTTHAHDPCAFSCGGCTLALSLASESSLSLAVTLPPIHPHRLPPPSPCPSSRLIHWAVITLSDSSCCFWARASAVSLVLASIEKPAVVQDAQHP